MPTKAELIERIQQLDALASVQKVTIERLTQRADAAISAQARTRKYANEVRSALDDLRRQSKAARLAQARLLLAEDHAGEEF